MRSSPLPIARGGVLSRTWKTRVPFRLDAPGRGAAPAFVGRRLFRCAGRLHPMPGSALVAESLNGFTAGQAVGPPAVAVHSGPQ